MLRSADAPKVPDLAAWIKQSRTAQELLKAAEPESKAIRARWEAEREETSVAGPVARGWTREKALAEVRATIKRAEIGGFEILTQYDVLPLNDGSQITVREALSNRDYYHELALRDPFEPEAGMSKAKLYLKDQREFPVLNSQLHGGCVYRLIDVEAVFGPPLSVLAPSAGLTLAPLPFVLSAGAPTPAFHVQPELAPVPALPVQAQSAPSWMPSNVVPFRAGVAEPMPSLSGGGAMPAPSAEPVPSAPGRSYPDLMDEIPERINASIEKAEASDLGFVVRQLMMRQFTAGEVLLVLERSMIAHKVPGLAAAVTEEAKKFEQREAQRKLNFEIGNDTGHASGRPNTPFVSLSKMLKTFVLIRKGTMVASLDSFKVLSYGEAMADLAGSKTKVTAANGKDTKEVPTLGLWQSNLERTTVDVVTWGPGRNLFCHAPDGSMGMKYALNVYRGLPAYAPSPDWEQQAAIFDRHIEYLVPVAEERRLFTQWLAHMIQKPGELPHFAYVMITPTTGTGRNWLASVLVRVLRGYVATGLDMNRVLDSEFNGSLSQKLLAIVDECHEGMDGYKRHERGNTLKRIITEETRLINPKCERQHTEYNACRWLMFSNFEDPLPIDSQDRRIVYIENPKICQSAEYYKMLYGALVMPVFFDSVRHRLQTLDISDFNPGARAPWNEIKLRSLDAMKSDVDHALDNFVASWPGDFVLNRMVREYVQTAVSGPLDANHLKYAMRRAGFTATRKSIKYEGKMERIAILRKVTEGVLEMTSPSVLADYCRQWHQQFKLSGN